MSHSHEMRIVARDRTKVVRFAGADAHMHWSDLYNSCALVNGDEEPDQTTEGEVLIGSIAVKLPWKEVVRIIEEDAGLCGELVMSALADPAELTLVS